MPDRMERWADLSGVFAGDIEALGIAQGVTSRERIGFETKYRDIQKYRSLAIVETQKGPRVRPFLR